MYDKALPISGQGIVGNASILFFEICGYTRPITPSILYKCQEQYVTIVIYHIQELMKVTTRLNHTDSVKILILLLLGL